MRWKGRAQSRNVEDRRRGGAKVVGGGLGVGAILFFIAYTLLTGEPPTDMMRQIPGAASQSTTVTTTENDELAEFTKVVLKDTEDVWHQIFEEELGARYREPVLVLYSGSTMAGCGFASAAMGPFYCPADEKIYIDLDFFRDLRRKFGVSGDFAMAYIIAHEVGHHVQKLLGITDAVQKRRPYLSKKDYNKLSVRMELQADYLAGVWARRVEKMKHVLDENDIEEAVRAAAAVGDDYLQKKYTGRVVPDAFTHGTSEQRVRWFLKGFKNGTLRGGDTFSADQL
ncbi:MAG: zinc metallopeptidase [Chlorobi bacterium]|nr:zinc metallopeptidase [Chlorobiota bacterium]